jgi:hypothetical protein
MEEPTPTLVQHMEFFFGPVRRGFSVPQDLTATPGVQYVRFKGGTVENVTVISTLGLSRFELASPKSNKPIHQELFLMFRDEEVPTTIPAVLHQIVNERLHSRIAVLRGEVLKRDGLIIPEADFVALYASLPVYYPDEMWACQTNGANVVLCWLFPITDQEERFISQRGWSEFEAVLDQANFDLFNLRRPNLV